MVHQEAPLIADLTVAETVAVNLGFPTVGGFIRWKKLTEKTLRRLGEFGVDIDPARLCRSLNPSERALVSLAIALGDIEVNSAVLILDEATASLSTADATQIARPCAGSRRPGLGRPNGHAQTARGATVL